MRISLGVGVLPNHNRRWGQAYRPAFTLLAADTSRPGDTLWIERDAEPGDWLRGSVHRYTTTVRVAPATPPGTYMLADLISQIQGSLANAGRKGR